MIIYILRLSQRFVSVFQKYLANAQRRINRMIDIVDTAAPTANIFWLRADQR